MAKEIFEVEYQFDRIIGMMYKDKTIITKDVLNKALESEHIKELLKNGLGIPVVKDYTKDYSISIGVPVEDIIGYCTRIQQRDIYTYGLIRFNKVSDALPLTNDIHMRMIATTKPFTDNQDIYVYTHIDIICFALAPPSNRKYECKTLMEGKLYNAKLL